MQTPYSGPPCPRDSESGRRRATRSVLGLLCTSLLVACGGSGSGADSVRAGNAFAAECELAPMREWVETNMLDYYLFADRVQPVPLEPLGSDEEVLDALRVTPEDRFSYLTDETTYDARFEQGRTFGFGWRLERTGPDTWLFSRVAPESPFDRAGIVRGDRLVAIGGVELPAFVELSREDQQRLLGSPDEPTRVTFTIETDAGGRRDQVVESADYPLVTVADVNVTETAGVRVGYLDFTSFIETSRAELDEAFEALANVDELVLDLRHNGGGRVDISAQLASAIAGPVVAGEVYTRFRHNDRYASRDLQLDFIDAAGSLDLPRVFVLTSERTCSASELVINGLEPFIDVVTIGDSTCGKPYATRPERRCGRVLNALEISSSNAVGVGDYTTGLTPDCTVEDDPRQAQGRPGDPLYDGALAFLGNGSCAAVAAGTRSGDRSRYPEPAFALEPAEVGAILP